MIPLWPHKSVPKYEIDTKDFPPFSLQTNGGTTTFPGPMRVPAVRLCDLCASGTFRCGLDSEYSGLDRSSIATGWFVIYSSISRDISSSGVNILSVSSSDGGFKRPFAALNAGIVVITKPALVKKIAMAETLSARLRKDGFELRDNREAESIRKSASL